MPTFFRITSLSCLFHLILLSHISIQHACGFTMPPVSYHTLPGSYRVTDLQIATKRRETLAIEAEMPKACLDGWDGIKDEMNRNLATRAKCCLNNNKQKGTVFQSMIEANSSMSDDGVNNRKRRFLVSSFMFWSQCLAINGEHDWASAALGSRRKSKECELAEARSIIDLIVQASSVQAWEDAASMLRDSKLEDKNLSNAFGTSPKACPNRRSKKT